MWLPMWVFDGKGLTMACLAVLIRNVALRLRPSAMRCPESRNHRLKETACAFSRLQPIPWQELAAHPPKFPISPELGRSSSQRHSQSGLNEILVARIPHRHVTPNGGDDATNGIWYVARLKFAVGGGKVSIMLARHDNRARLDRFERCDEVAAKCGIVRNVPVIPGTQQGQKIVGVGMDERVLPEIDHEFFGRLGAELAVGLGFEKRFGKAPAV